MSIVFWPMPWSGLHMIEILKLMIHWLHFASDFMNRQCLNGTFKSYASVRVFFVSIEMTLLCVTNVPLNRASRFGKCGLKITEDLWSYWNELIMILKN